MCAEVGVGIGKEGTVAGQKKVKGRESWREHGFDWSSPAGRAILSGFADVWPDEPTEVELPMTMAELLKRNNDSHAARPGESRRR
jgi:hypothetical protein